MLLNVKPEQDESTVEAIRKWAEEAGAAQNHSVWVLSERFNSVEKMGNIYRERLLKLMEFCFYYTNRAILIDGELPPMHPAGYQFNVNMFCSMSNAIGSKRLKNICMNMQRHWEETILLMCLRLNLFWGT